MTDQTTDLSVCPKELSYHRDKLRGTVKKRFLLQHTCFSVPLGVVAPDALLEENTSLTPPLPGPRVLRSEAEGLPEVTTAVSAAIRSFLW